MKDEIIRAMKAERRSTLGLLRGLDPERFDTPTALPGWRVREVAAHLVATDRATVTGSLLPVVLTSTNRLEAWNEKVVPKWAGRPIPQLIIGLERWGRRLERMARLVPKAAYRTNVRTPWGKGPGGYFFWVRAYDEWVHRQDIRRAIGMGDEDVDVAHIAEFLLTAIGTATLPQVSGWAGRVAVSLEGIPVPEWTYDLVTRTAAAEGGHTAEARILAAAPSFIMAAAGRDDFDDLWQTGSLKIEGDEPLARALLGKIRIV